MNHFTTSKVIAYLAFIFIAGGAAGAVIALKNSRDREVQPASMEKTCNRIQNRLVSKLSLTPVQVTKLQPVFDQAAEDLRAVQSRAVRDTDEILRKAHAQIAKELTPEQKIKLEQCDAQRHEWLKRCFKDHDGRSPKNDGKSLSEGRKRSEK